MTRILLPILLLALPAWATPNDDAFLTANGFPPSAYTLLWQWEELPPHSEGRLVTGYSLQPLGSTARIDLYRLGDTLLPTMQLSVLGIREKRWNEPLSAPSEPRKQTPGQSKAIAHPLGLASNAPIETLAMPPFTRSADLPSASTDPRAKPDNRIGDIRGLTAPILVNADTATLGAWTQLPGGSCLWRAAINSPGATGQRLHIATATLSEGASLIVYNPTNPDEAFHYDGQPDTWLPTVFNEEVVIELYLYAPATTPLHLEIDRTIHIFAPLERFQKANPGACNLDVTCYPDWADTALGVCGLGVVTTEGALFCTGTLLADTDLCSTTPYVLTAHHCVGGQGGAAGASNVEFYWSYQTPACNGVAPGLNTVPRTTGGADYLGGSSGTGSLGGGNDFTLLRPRALPPTGASYLGWSSQSPPLNTPVTDIHHPRGSHKRISFGHLTNTDNPFSTDYHEVTWDNGTTEPGSSGSALFRADTQELIGQLWGGGASCSNQSEPDYFGRFSKTIVAMQAYLDPGPNAAQFLADTYTASEGDPTATITVKLSRPAPPSGIEVNFAASPGTALANIDFIPTSGTLQFASGATTRSFPITLLQDNHADNGVTVALTLSAQTCGSVSPTLGTAQLVLLDDNPDTDGDGVSDFDEINGTFGPPTNPNLADSDRDGLNDYQELFDVYGYDTDPNDADTDDDEVSDWFELVNGTDPTVAEAVGLSSLPIPWFTIR